MYFSKKVCSSCHCWVQKKYLFHLLKPKHFSSVLLKYEICQSESDLFRSELKKCSDILQSEWGLSVLIVSQYSDSASIDIS